MEFPLIQSIDEATRFGRREMFRFGTILLFVIGVMLLSTSIHRPVSVELVIAAMIGAYMAMNIGANDVANNVGPAVGSRAITLVGAIFIAAIFESAGALIAGGDVVGTITSRTPWPPAFACTIATYRRFPWWSIDTRIIYTSPNTSDPTIATWQSMRTGWIGWSARQGKHLTWTAARSS